MAEGFKAPPIAGYQDVSGERADIVNHNKIMEETLLRLLDSYSEPVFDARWAAIARTHFEQGFMAMNRAVFRPKRIEGDI